MSQQHDESDNHQHLKGWVCSRTGVVTAGALAILGFLVYTGHSAHLLGLVPYLFILACPLMHIFMHGKHHHHHSGKDGEEGGSHSHGGDCCADGGLDKAASANPTKGE